MNFFLADHIQNRIDFQGALDAATVQYGKSITEEAAAKLAELREQEQRLTIELSSIAEKTAIMAEWQVALDSLKGSDITGRLYDMAEQNPIAFRRLLSIVFERNSLKVRTQRKGKKWVGMLEDYKLTEAMQDVTLSFESIPGRLSPKDRVFFELSELLTVYVH